METVEQYLTLGKMFDYYNKELFNGGLPDCMITVGRHIKCAGYFKPEKWKSNPAKVEPVIHEIILNPDCLGGGNLKWHMELVHAMDHLWQYEHREVSRNGCQLVFEHEFITGEPEKIKFLEVSKTFMEVKK